MAGAINMQTLAIRSGTGQRWSYVIPRHFFGLLLTSLQMLNQYGVVDETRNRRYLLEKTQHLVGGFGKGPGDPPGTMQHAKLTQF